jgi:hypothetical protein
MTSLVYCLGLLFCGIAGFIDRNPSIWRFVSTIILFSLGVMLLFTAPSL